MNTALPIIALVLAVVAYVTGRKDAAGTRPQIWAFVGLVAFLFLAVRFGSSDPKLTWPLAGGITLGAIGALAAEWLGVSATSLALGVAVAAVARVFGKGVVTAEMGMAVGAVIATLFARGGGQAALLTAAVFGVGFMDALGSSQANAPAAATFGSMLGVIAAAAGIVAMIVRPKPVFWAAASFVIAVGGYYAEHKVAAVTGAGLPIALGSLTGLVCLYLLPEERSDPFRMTVGAVLWLGLATLAYGPGRGFGMSAAFLSGIAVPIALNRGRVLATSAPLAALVVVSLFNQLHGKEAAALYISQHYVLIGLAIGAILPAAYEAWREQDVRLPALGAFLWSLLAVGVPAALLYLVDSKGMIGFILGLGFGGFFFVRSVITPRPLAFAAGIGSAVLLIVGRFADVASVARSDKMRYVVYGACLIAVVAVPIVLLVRPKEENPS